VSGSRFATLASLSSTRGRESALSAQQFRELLGGPRQVQTQMEYDSKSGQRNRDK
jgi:hypothetical protein